MTHEAGAAPLDLAGARVLVVEDNVDLAENLAEIAEACDAAEVEIAHGAAELDARALWAWADVVLCDIRLPDASGLDLLPRLKNGADGLSEVLLITGSASLDDAVAAVDAGAFAYVLKPFDPEALVRSLCAAYERVALRRDARRLTRALERSEERLRTLVDAVQALLLVLDEQGSIVQANSAVCSILEVDEPTLVGRNWFEEFVPPADREAARESFAAVLAGDESVAPAERVMGSAADELDARWVSWRSAVLDTSEGRRIYRSGLDVTEVRELERRARLAERLAAVGTMSAGLAHEIRNPLNAAVLQLELLGRRLRRAGIESAEVLEPIGLVRGEIDRLGRLVREFLAFARPADVRVAVMDLRDVARTVHELAKPTLPDVDLMLVVDVRPVLVAADEEKLRGVVLNLVRNAGEALADHGVDHRGIRIEVGVEDGEAHLRVIDNGPGIPEDMLTRVFEPFYSTREQGTGLGLAISHSVVAQHGGTLTASTNAGTIMEIRLPLA